MIIGILEEIGRVIDISFYKLRPVFDDCYIELGTLGSYIFVVFTVMQNFFYYADYHTCKYDVTREVK